jgi:hypothetical protein
MELQTVTSHNTLTGFSAMTPIATMLRNVSVLFALLATGCDAAPPGVVDDRSTTSTIEFTAGADQDPRQALVTSSPRNQTYKNWISLQPYLAGPRQHQVTFKGFDVLGGPEHLVILVPPASWDSKGWVMVCEEDTYRQDRGACGTEGMVGDSVVHITGWTSDIGNFQAIVASATEAFEEAGLGSAKASDSARK